MHDYKVWDGSEAKTHSMVKKIIGHDLVWGSGRLPWWRGVWAEIWKRRHYQVKNGRTEGQLVQGPIVGISSKFCIQVGGWGDISHPGSICTMEICKHGKQDFLLEGQLWDICWHPLGRRWIASDVCTNHSLELRCCIRYWIYYVTWCSHELCVVEIFTLDIEWDFKRVNFPNCWAREWTRSYSNPSLLGFK